MSLSPKFVSPLLAALIGLAPVVAAADAPARIPVQGILRDAAGATVQGEVPVTFALYAQAAGGEPLWTDALDVAFDAGFFSIYLGTGRALPLDLFRANGSLFLGIAIDGDPEMDRLEIATAPFAAFAQYAGDAATLGGRPPEAFALAGHTTPWASIPDVPPELTDGDDDTTYDVVPRGGLVLEEGRFGLLSVCGEAEVLKRDATGWACAQDELGGGDIPDDELILTFTLDGTLLSVADAGGAHAVDLRPLLDGIVEGDADPANELLRAVDYNAATGLLSLTEAERTFTVDLSGLVDADGDPRNELMLAANLNGTVLRLTDAGGTLNVDLASLVTGLDPSADNELNTALRLDGTTLSITDPGGTFRVDLAPLWDDADADPANELNTAIRLAGTQLILTDAGGDVQVDLATLRDTYTAGRGLALAGTTFSVDPAVVQTRVMASCPAGQSIRQVSQDGAVTCEADNDTLYSSGQGLVLNGTQFSVDRAATQVRVAGTCVAGSSIRVVNIDGTVGCEADDNTTYTSGAGLSLVGTQFSVNTAVTQARVTGTCAVGSAVRVVNADGSVTCEADDNTTYAAGIGLGLTGTTFSLQVTGQQGSYSLAQPAGNASDAQTAHWLGLRFRIAGGGATGRLEFTRDGGAAWGTVCDDGFSDLTARVICRGMGYSTGTMVLATNTVDGAAGTPILIDNMQCPTDARNFLDCRVSALGTTNCGHTEDVGVTCSP